MQQVKLVDPWSAETEPLLGIYGLVLELPITCHHCSITMKVVTRPVV